MRRRIPFLSSRHLSTASTANKDGDDDIHRSSYEAVLRMPVSYAEDISDGQGVGIFVKILMRWRGSVYKLLWPDLAIYIGIYYILYTTNRYLLSKSQQKTFEALVIYCDNMKSNIPLPFLLGFFVAGVVGRWWTLYRSIPWLNRISFAVNSFIIGNGPQASRKVRLVVMRYMNLAWILLMRSISVQIAKRFQCHEEDHLEAGEEVVGCAAGESPNSPKTECSLRIMFENFNRDEKIRSTYKKIITTAEIKAFENIATKHFAAKKTRYMPEYWVPMQWAARCIQKAFIHGYVGDPRTAYGLINEIESLRGQMHTLQIYCSNMIPLVYTQVVIIAVYSYFLCQLFSSQLIEPEAKEGTPHKSTNAMPIFDIFLFLFMMGWMKVALCVMNPFGDDDEDFQTSIMLDYTLDTTFRTAQAHNTTYPEQLQPVQIFYRKNDAYVADGFHKFLNEIDDDLDDLDVFETPRSPNRNFAKSVYRKLFGCCRKRRRLSCMTSFYTPQGPSPNTRPNRPSSGHKKRSRGKFKFFPGGRSATKHDPVNNDHTGLQSSCYSSPASASDQPNNNPRIV